MAGNDDPRTRLLGKFRAIALERLARLNAAFGELEQGDGNQATADSLMREIHTLKGESHMMGFPAMNEVAHRTEDLLTWSRRHDFVVDGAISDLVYQGFDLLLAYAADDADEDELERRKSAFTGLAAELLSDEASTGLTAPIAPSPGPKAGGDSPGSAMARTAAAAAPAKAATPATGAAATTTTTTTTTTAAATGSMQRTRTNGRASGTVGGGLGDYIRVPATTLVALTSLSGQLLLHQEATARLVQHLWESQRDAPSTADGAGGSAIAQLRQLRDESFQSGLRLAELQDTVRTLRLLQVGVLFERYPAAIRDLARQRGRVIRVVLEGGDVSVDKQVLDVLDEAILHLVRNSVDHGIEPPDERGAAGKTERGTLWLTARQLGSRVEISVRDDGRGVSPAAVRAAAVKRGLLTADDAGALDDQTVLRLLFRPGFSTREDVTDLSGRGVGLDVVGEKVRQLGGTIDLSSTPGQGATFTLTLPVSIALLRVLCFHCGSTIYGLPSAAVHRVMRITADSVERAGRGSAIEVSGARIPLVDLRRTFRSGATEHEDHLEIAVIEYGDTRLALAVDGFLGERQVVQRSMGAFLAGVRLLSGTGILEERQVALLLSVPELLRRWGEGDPLARAVPLDDKSASDRTILIVDDSELTRDMLVTVARQSGLDVIEAVNGRDALSKLQIGVPDLIMTDLDMPVMDGFEFLSRLRGDPALRHTPVVVLTTRGSDEDKRRAMAAGADAFLIKSRFSSEELTSTIGRFLDVKSP